MAFGQAFPREESRSQPPTLSDKVKRTNVNAGARRTVRVRIATVVDNSKTSGRNNIGKPPGVTA